MTNKITLEQLLRMKVKVPTRMPAYSSQPIEDQEPVEITPDFRVAVQEVTNEGVRIIIHPMGHDGETLDFWVTGNELRQVR